jgi:hypothetical protein
MFTRDVAKDSIYGSTRKDMKRERRALNILRSQYGMRPAGVYKVKSLECWSIILST